MLGAGSAAHRVYRSADETLSGPRIVSIPSPPVAPRSDGRVSLRFEASRNDGPASANASALGSTGIFTKRPLRSTGNSHVRTVLDGAEPGPAVTLDVKLRKFKG